MALTVSLVYQVWQQQVFSIVSGEVSDSVDSSFLYSYLLATLVSKLAISSAVVALVTLAFFYWKSYGKHGDMNMHYFMPMLLHFNH
jgi:hypothetical protein